MLVSKLVKSNDSNSLQPKNALLIKVTFDVSKLLKSIVFNLEDEVNIYSIVSKDDVTNVLKFNEVKEVLSNILIIVVTFEVSKLLKSTEVKEHPENI